MEWMFGCAFRRWFLVVSVDFLLLPLSPAPPLLGFCPMVGVPCFGT